MPTPQENFVTLQQRVRYVTGKVTEIQGLFRQIAAEEQALRRTAGEPPDGVSWGSVILSATPVVGQVYQTYRNVRGEAGAWPRFYAGWADRAGPRIREMMSAVARFEQFGTPGWQVAPPDRQQEFTQLLQAGNRACRDAVNLLHNWRATPMSRFDAANTGWVERWSRRLFAENSVLVQAAALTTGRGTGHVVHDVGTRVETAEQAITATRGTGGGAAPELTRRGPDTERTGPSGTVILVTLLLLAVGGGLVYIMVKDWLSPKKE